VATHGKAACSSASLLGTVQVATHGKAARRSR